MNKLWMILCILLALCAGCAGRAADGAPSNAGNYYSSPSGGGPTTYSSQSAPSPTGTSFDSTARTEIAPPAPPPTSMGPSGGVAETHVAPPAREAPRERPGLGTEWGETRFSRVRETTFVRSDEGRPFAVTTLHYNDRAGVQALANFHGATGRTREFSARGGAITVSLRDGSGDPLEAFHVGDRMYVIGQAGERYAMVLTNHTNHRFEVVATVDGLDVVSGRPGNLTNRGYVLMPFATLEIDGFRQSQDAVAAFRFGRVSDSYASQMGNARNVGVIGIAFFAERGDVYSEDELERRDTANPFPGSDMRFARPPR